MVPVGLVMHSAQAWQLQIRSAFVEGTSPLGFWAARKIVPVQSEIRVYPNLLNDRKNLAALFLNRGVFGLHAQRQIGKGRDFEKLREYIPGDGYDEIHWKATARRGKPITKVFQIEKTQEVYVVVDASRLSARTTTETAGADSALERFVTAALVLGLAAEQQGDLFGLLTFTDKVEKFVRAKNGESHYNACRDALYTLQPKIVTPDFDELCYVRPDAFAPPRLAGFSDCARRSGGGGKFCPQLGFDPPPTFGPREHAATAGSGTAVCESGRRERRRFVSGARRPFALAKIARVTKGFAAARRAIFPAQQRTVECRTGVAILEHQTKTIVVIVDLQRFIANERPFWNELEKLLDHLEAEPDARMSLGQLQLFHQLYERTAAGLAKITTFSSEPEIRRYLENLVARAYGEIHETREKQRRFFPLQWFFQTLPQTFRRHMSAHFTFRWPVTIAGCAFGGLAIAFDPDAKPVLMPFPHLMQDPRQRVAEEERCDGRPAGRAQDQFLRGIDDAQHQSLHLHPGPGMTWGFGTRSSCSFTMA